MAIIVIVGAQWGDEAKGKITDLYSELADVVVRYAGGANAGHTLVFNGQQTVFHLVPSAALRLKERKDLLLVLGDDMVIDPEQLLQEINMLFAAGIELHPGNLAISSRAHLVLPYHKLLDQLRDQGSVALGTTKRGIGPCYADRAHRIGLRVGDLLHRDILRDKLRRMHVSSGHDIRTRGGTPPNYRRYSEIRSNLYRWADRLAGFVTDTVEVLRQRLTNEMTPAKVLFEGAQGALLDITHGTYPYVTSSNTTAGAASSGSGVPPCLLGRGTVVGVIKAYTTRVGNGPFPTRFYPELEARVRQQGREFGATTGRPRDCGWLNAYDLRRATWLNGFRVAAFTKLDVLSGLPQLHICTGYNLNGEELVGMPLCESDWDLVEPVYETMEGFELESGRNYSHIRELPQAARYYIYRTEKLIGVRFCYISLGPGRDQGFWLENPLDHWR